MLEKFAELGGWGYVITSVFTGLFIVFLALALLIGFVSLLGIIFSAKKKPTNNNNAGNNSKTVTSSNNSAVEDGISDEVVAVIAAAIAAMSADGKSYAIRSIKKSKNGVRPVWATAGLQENTRPF